MSIKGNRAGSRFALNIWRTVKVKYVLKEAPPVAQLVESLRCRGSGSESDLWPLAACHPPLSHPVPVTQVK